MKNIVHKIAIVAFCIAAVTSAISCSTVQLTDEYLAKYPLENQSEVLESKRSTDDLFSATRSYLIERYPGAATGSKAVMDKSMISLPISKRFTAPASLGQIWTIDMYYTILVEFKDGRMRVQAVDVYSIPKSIGYESRPTAINYGTISKMSGLRGSASNDEQCRKATSEEYLSDWDEIVSAMKKVADGTMEGLDW